MSTTTVRVLLDTAACLTVICTRDVAAARTIFADYVPGEIGISSMTVAALQTRVERSDDPDVNRRALDQFLLPLVVVDFDAEAAHRLGQIAAWWTRTPNPRITHVQILAAQAVTLGAVLVTSRPDLYAAVPELRLNTVLAEAPAIAKSTAETSVKAAGVRPEPAHLIRSTTGIIAMGSHDMTLELLGDSLHAANPGVTLVSAHVGSLQGLLALQRNEAHLAGTHLLDGATGEYNVTQVKQLLAAHGIRTVLVGFVRRVQGLIVAAGNPKQLTGFDDLARADVRFVNRQRGAGTRVLLDYELQRRGIACRTIQGYDQTESSHMAVAMAVADGTADCGLGIQAAARSHNLAFLPLSEERYDLVIPVEHYTSPRLAPLLAMLRRPPAEFLRRVHALGGYRTDGMGAVLGEF